MSLKEAMAILAASGDAPPLGFAPSKLGTRAHWESVYAREVLTHREIGDEGEVWFGEDAAEAMLDWALENVPPSPALHTLDVGTGNGQLLFALHSARYSNLTGLDYSAASVELAKAIAVQRGVEDVSFVVCDVLREELAAPEQRFGLILDKGTYDAVCLSDETDNGQKLCELYPARIARLLAPGSVFLITSCNWTRAELEAAFITPATGLKYHSHIPRPSFGFGGSVGSTITTLALQN